jgi:hypothetical protein
VNSARRTIKPVACEIASSNEGEQAQKMQALLKLPRVGLIYFPSIGLRVVKTKIHQWRFLRSSKVLWRLSSNPPGGAWPSKVRAPACSMHAEMSFRDSMQATMSSIFV